MNASEIANDLNLFASRADEATRIGAPAFARLLQLAEERDSGQITRVVRFIAGTYNGQAFPARPIRASRSRHRDQQRHALLPRCAALGSRRPVQARPGRLRWFRRVLRETASKGVQIVVLTCPGDYLEPAETPPPHVIDVGEVTGHAI